MSPSSTPANHPIYSIGYATKPITLFAEQLAAYNIDVIVDIRSVPYSKAFHDYQQNHLRAWLHRRNIHYIWMGEELGPRSKDQNCYNHQGQVQFTKLQQTPLFTQGIQRILKGQSRGYCMALLCAEKDAAICHRSLLVGHHLLHQQQTQLQHIDHTGSQPESQGELEDRLMSLTGCQPDFFQDQKSSRLQAWQRQCQLYAYKKPLSSPQHP